MIPLASDIIEESARDPNAHRRRAWHLESPVELRPILLDGREVLKAMMRGQFPIRNGAIFHARKSKLKSVAQRLELADDDVGPFESLTWRREITS